MSVVAGLVATQHVVRVVGLRDGSASFSTDAIEGAKWSAGAELGVQRAADGVAVIWRDGLGATSAGTLVLLGPNGEVRGAPVEVGAAMCTTAEGLAWIEPRRGDSGRMVRVLERGLTESTSREILSLSSDRSPTLVCGVRSVFVLGDGDDDLTIDVFVPGSSVRAPTLVLRDAAFADEEREHEAFAVGDDLELVRVGATGGIATRTIPGAGKDDHSPSAWRRLKHVLSDDDDVVAVDGQGSRTLLVFTRDMDTACATPESGGQRIRAFAFDRPAGTDRLIELAPAGCQGQRGPFWIPAGLSEAQGPVVAWVERGSKGENAAAISGLAFRVVHPDAVQSGRVEVAADALVDGDCDDKGCYAAALLREPGSDGMSPGAIAVVTYP